MDRADSSETQLCVCGDLRSNKNLLLLVVWHRNHTAIEGYYQDFGNKTFTTCLDQVDGFQPGHYEIAIHRNKRVVVQLNFDVEEAP